MQAAPGWPKLPWVIGVTFRWLDFLCNVIGFPTLAAKVRRGLISPLTYPHELVWKKNQLMFTLVMPFPQIKIIVFPPYLRSYQPPKKDQHVWGGRITSGGEVVVNLLGIFAKCRDTMLVLLLPFCIQGLCLCLCLPPLVKLPMNLSQLYFIHLTSTNHISSVLLQSQPQIYCFLCGLALLFSVKNSLELRWFICAFSTHPPSLHCPE